jgi:hypothetical protein
MASIEQEIAQSIDWSRVSSAGWPSCPSQCSAVAAAGAWWAAIALAVPMPSGIIASASKVSSFRTIDGIGAE